MKECIICHDTKTLDSFYKHKGMGDGHLNKCIPCTKKQTKDRRFGKDRQAILAYDRQRGNRQSINYTKEYRDKFPKKYKAHRSVERAIRNKSLIRQGCEKCGKDKAHAHHDNYNEPLEVRWLCSEHHQEWHSKHKPIL
jgi:hypothetical protein